MQLAAVIFVLCLSTQSSILGLEAGSSGPLCTTADDSTNCSHGKSEDDASNRTSSMCNSGMEMSENTPTNCQPLTDISNTSETDIEEGNGYRFNFTATPSDEYNTDPQYKEDLSDKNSTTTEGQNGKLISSNENNSSMSEDIAIDLEIISILEHLPDLLNEFQDENKITNSSNSEDISIFNPTELVHNFIDSLVGHENYNNTTENPTESDATYENSFWDKLFRWPSLKIYRYIKQGKRKKREDVQHSIDSEEYQELENDGANPSTSEEMGTQSSNSTENCDSGECDSSTEVGDSPALPSNYDIKITEIRNEIVILQNEILENDPGETTTAAVWNTNRFVDRLRYLVPKYFDTRNVNTVLNDNVTPTTDQTQSTFVNDEDIFLMETVLLDVIEEEIDITLQTNTTAQPDVISLYLVNSTLEEPPNTLTDTDTNVTATEENNH